MEQDPHMDHDQTNEPSGPHETHDGDETGQINDEGQPNNDEIETNEGGEAQAETRPTRNKNSTIEIQRFCYTSSPFTFLVAITNNDEAKCFKQAAQDDRWREAMQKEINFKPNGKVRKYKARLVVKGFTQMEGVDYHDTFAPVAKVVTVRTLLAVVIKRDWIIHQLDVDNAFLHGDLDEEVYMKIPQGFSNDNETRVCRLRKSLYGLKRASLNW
ncbi:retrovirus-related pol polyprotein from transposon TNT 1-94 [Tanacetum coccineum]